MRIKEKTSLDGICKIQKTMYEKIELERIRNEKERELSNQKRDRIENRFRCIELAKGVSNDVSTIISEANKFLHFIES